MKKNLLWFGLLMGMLYVPFVSCAGVNEDLLHAATMGDAAKVKQAIAQGADVNAKDERGWCPLILASRIGDVDTVKVLIDKGAKVNAKDNAGMTPLIHASASGHSVAVVKLLIERGADVSIKDKNGDTALEWAYNDEISKLIKSYKKQKAK
jgi:ankyrin repeat protein